MDKRDEKGDIFTLEMGSLTTQHTYTLPYTPVSVLSPSPPPPHTTHTHSLSLSLSLCSLLFNVREPPRQSLMRLGQISAPPLLLPPRRPLVLRAARRLAVLLRDILER